MMNRNTMIAPCSVKYLVVGRPASMIVALCVNSSVAHEQREQAPRTKCRQDDRDQVHHADPLVVERQQPGLIRPREQLR
jgi:hypothetical protein